MQLKFTWEDRFGLKNPTCQSDQVNDDGVSLLSCLLMDDGGQGFEATVPWITDGINIADRLIRGEIDRADWARETWGAALDTTNVRIYSLHDENYAEMTPLLAFREALAAWRTFVEAGPRDDDVVVEL